jgi:hypothetical protein
MNSCVLRAKRGSETGSTSVIAQNLGRQENNPCPRTPQALTCVSRLKANSCRPLLLALTLQGIYQIE